MGLTPTQEQACQALEDALLGKQLAQAQGDAPLPEDYNFSAALDNDELEDLDDEEHENLDEMNKEVWKDSLISWRMLYSVVFWIC